MKNKDIRTTSALAVSLVDFGQVNVCCDVIKSLLNDFWSILKILCSKYCSRSSYFYWHNTLIYLLLNKNAGDTFKYYILENLISSEKSCAGNMVKRQVKQRMARVKLHIHFFSS